MDALKNAISGNKTSSTGQQSTSNTQSTTSGQNQDYGDKAFKAANDKAGWGLDESKREKISDFGRSAYEKATGNKVDPKYSN
ncbi:hypothetical protein MGN70_008734 [Eutypa lata]|uniref:Uncharacterized protein n=1 Tax=Eutypa lata (strain UCR-EL1) TaxID=1287681 RepID=M7SAA5_EUTLA|nr:hypothetical protein UCREL1_9980 [Eutypa lata UCREL1]KAI1249125.1 hypothetical protein MGN70_008734 [Eutypa lata]